MPSILTQVSRSLLQHITRTLPIYRPDMIERNYTESSTARAVPTKTYQSTRKADVMTATVQTRGEMDSRRVVQARFRGKQWAGLLFACLVGTASFAAVDSSSMQSTGNLHAATNQSADGFMALATGDSHSDEVPVGARSLTVRFAQAVRARTLNNQTVTLIGPTGAAAIKIQPGADGRSMFLKPSEELLPGSAYSLFVKGAQTKAGGNVGLAALSFHTAVLEPTRSIDLGSTVGDDESYSPGADAVGSWRSSRPLPRFVNERLRMAPSRDGSPGVSGLVLALSDKPLAGVTVSIDGKTTRTGAEGKFVLTDVKPGQHQMIINGATANRPGHQYPQIVASVRVGEGKITEMIHPIYLPRIRDKDWVDVTAPTQADLVVRHPDIPDLEIHIPKGTVLRDLDGKILTRFAIVPVPIERSALPLPVQLPIAVMLHPGGTRIQTVEGPVGGGGIQLVYPNYAHQPPGTGYDLWAHSPHDNGWMVYARGKVSDDGLQVVADADSALREFMECGGPSLPIIGSPPPPPTCSGGGAGGPPGSGSGGGGGSMAGDPVECGTGIFILTREEAKIRDVTPIEFRRTYRPSDTVVRPFGIGTTHNYAIYLRAAWSTTIGGYYDYSSVDLVLPDAEIVHFAAADPTSAGLRGYNNAVYHHAGSPTQYYGATLVGWTMDTDFQEIWKLTMRDGTVYNFLNNGYGNLKSIVDRNGNKTSFTYDASSRLASIVSPNGRYVSLSYDSGGRISTMTDSANRTWSYKYTATTGGYLQQATYPDGSTESYTYDSQGRMLTIVDDRGNTMLTNEYDAQDRVTKQTYADATTASFRYTTDASGHVTQTDFTDERGHIRRYVFNASGYMTSVTRALGRPEEQTRSFTRDPVSNLVLSETDALGRKTTYQYDALGNITTLTKLAGTSSAATWRSTYQALYSLKLSSTDPLGHTTQYSYDDHGNLTRVTDPLGHSTTMTYNSDGQTVTASVYPQGTAATTTYGYRQGDLISITDPLGRQTTLSTDEVGRLIGVRDALGNLTETYYDPMDRISEIIDPLGNSVQFGYDGNGNITSFTDARGNTTNWTYDPRNRVQTKTDALQQVESYQYDQIGNLSTITDRNGQISGFTYDGLNRRITAGYGATGTSGTYTSTTSYNYDAGNRLRQIVDSLGGTITRTYDDLDHMTQETTPQGSVSSTWDSADRRQTRTAGNQTQVTYTWDDASRLKTITQGTAGIGFSYDDANRRTLTTLANGIKVTYAWDDANQLKSITYTGPTGTSLGTLTYGYDDAGRRTSMGGTLAAVNLPAAVSSATYDVDNRLTNWDGTTISYDANGNITNDGSKTFSWNARNQLSGIGTTGFGYDGAGRRIAITSAGQTKNFLYDGLQPAQEQTGGTPTANLLHGPGIDELLRRTVGSATGDYLADALGGTLALTDASGAITTSYTYAPYGATTTSGTVSDNTYEFTGRENDGTGLYYYRARYYNPVYGRFVSEDPIGLAGGSNLYGYVNGQPTMKVDPLGLASVLPGPIPLPVPLPSTPVPGGGSGDDGSYGGILEPGTFPRPTTPTNTCAITVQVPPPQYDPPPPGYGCKTLFESCMKMVGTTSGTGWAICFTLWSMCQIVQGGAGGHH